MYSGVLAELSEELKGELLNAYNKGARDILLSLRETLVELPLSSAASNELTLMVLDRVIAEVVKDIVD